MHLHIVPVKYVSGTRELIQTCYFSMQVFLKITTKDPGPLTILKSIDVLLV